MGREVGGGKGERWGGTEEEGRGGRGEGGREAGECGVMTPTYILYI